MFTNITEVCKSSTATVDFSRDKLECGGDEVVVSSRRVRCAADWKPERISDPGPYTFCIFLPTVFAAVPKKCTLRAVVSDTSARLLTHHCYIDSRREDSETILPYYML